jgi:hypothetical protein
MYTDQQLSQAHLLFEYLYLQDTPQNADAVIGFGHFDTKIPQRCAELNQQGLAPRIVFTGGVGAGSADLPMPEAVFFQQWVQAHAPHIPKQALVIESASTNTADNLRFSQKLLAEQYSLVFGTDLQKILLVANAYRQRRVYLTCRKLFPGLTFVNTPPSTTFEQEMRLFQDKNEDFVAHLVAEMQRIQDYPAKDWIEYEEIPGEVSEAWKRLHTNE